jgi:DNA-directed RNA polymerase subunit M/transcription elongation factor TFIIS
MNLDDQFKLEHLLLKERKCRTCNKTKSLLDDYYLIRRVRGDLPSSYSYECKNCTIDRVLKTRQKGRPVTDLYPDW